MGLAEILGVLGKGAQGGLQGYQYGQEQRANALLRQRQTEQDAMQQQLQMAQLAHYSRQAEQQKLENERQAGLDAIAQAEGLGKMRMLQSEAVAKGLMTPEAAYSDLKAYPGFHPEMKQAPVSPVLNANPFFRINPAVVPMKQAEVNPFAGMYRAAVKPAAQQKPIILSEGQRAVDPSTNKVIAQGGPKTFAPKTPPKQQAATLTPEKVADLRLRVDMSDADDDTKRAAHRRIDQMTGKKSALDRLLEAK